MKRLTILFITLCIAVFVWVGLSGINFIQNTTVKDEGFNTSTGPITRASDCNCLPGYIPSSDNGDYNGKIFQIVTNGLQYLFNPEGTKKIYWINPENSCGITMSGTYPSLSIEQFFSNGSEYSYSGNLQCNFIKKKQSTQSIFFCQNLTSPEKRRNCY